MSTVEKKRHYTVEEYFAIDEANEFKSEYYYGEIFAMSGGTPIHSQINGNIISVLKTLLRGKKCIVYDSNLKVEIIPSNAYVFPDITVVCGELEYAKGKKDTIVNPGLVIEVLSKSTGLWDRGGKLHNYQKLKSIQECLLVEQDSAQVDIYQRDEDDFWKMKTYYGLETSIPIKSLGVELPMSEIYDNVVFENRK